MKVLIICGGLATRLGNITKKIPKSLIEIKKKKFIDYQLHWLKKNSFQNIILCTGHYNNQIKKHVGTGKKYGLKVEYSDDGKKLLGTGGSIKKALKKVKGIFLVLNGDSFLTFDPKKILKKYNKIKIPIMTITRSSKSNVKIKNNLISEYKKKGLNNSNFIDYGMVLFDSKLIWPKIKNGKFDMETVYRKHIINKKISFLMTSKKYYEIGSIEGLEKFKKLKKYI